MTRNVLSATAAFGVLTACASSDVPDPRSAASAYAEAAARGDASTIYDLMSEAAKKTRSRDDVARVVAGERAELAEQAKALSAKEARVEATARLRFEDGGPVAELVKRAGQAMSATV